MDQWASVVAASWLQGWDDCSLCVSQMRRLSLVVLKWGINVAEVMTMMSTHHFFSLGRWCVLSWSAMSSARKRDWSWHRDSPAVLYLVTLGDRAIRPEFCVWWREVTARITWKLSEKPQQLEQLAEGFEQLTEQLEQLLKQTEQLPGSS